MFENSRSEEFNAVVLPSLSIEPTTSPIPLSEHQRDAFRPYFVKGILRISDNVELIVSRASVKSSAERFDFGEKTAFDSSEW